MLSVVAVVFVIMVSVGSWYGLTNAEVIKTNGLASRALSRSTCDLNDNYWNLIRSYFERVTYIEVTEITRHRLHYSIFANKIIRELGLSKYCLLCTLQVSQFNHIS